MITLPDLSFSVPKGRKRKCIKDESASAKHEDSNNAFAAHVANKLRNIQPDQLKFVHKLISDVLFEAEMQSLNRNFILVDRSIINISPPLKDYSKRQAH